MLPVSWSIISFLSARQASGSCWILKISRNQELRSVASYIPLSCYLSAIYAVQALSVCSLALLFLVSNPSITVFVSPYILIHFIWFVFIVGQTLKPAWKQKLVRIQYCSYYSLVGENYRPEVTSAYSGNL